MRRGVLLLVGGEREVELVRAFDAPGTGLAVTRRCADVTELLAAVAAGAAQAAVVDTATPGVDAALVARAEEADVRVVVLTAVGDEPHWSRASAAVAAGTPARQVVHQVSAALVRGTTSPDDGGDGYVEEEVDEDQEVPQPQDQVTDEALADLLGQEEAAPGQIVAVWGTGGAPGRTTVAVNLAAELAELAAGGGGRRRRRRGGEEEPRGDGRPILLVDADTEGPCMAQVLGLLEEASSIAAIARRAAHGRLNPAGLLSLSPALREGLHVATGLSRADRWRELPTSSLDDLWDCARRAAQVTVVDVGAGAEEPPPGLEAWGTPPRHAATRSALQAADVLLVVGAADVVGVRRMLEALTMLSENSLAPTATVVPVMTKVRASAVGKNPEQAVLAALEEYTDTDSAVMIPDDRAALDQCLLEGRVLMEQAPGSAARAPVRDLARWLLPAQQGVGA